MKEWAVDCRCGEPQYFDTDREAYDFVNSLSPELIKYNGCVYVMHYTGEETGWEIDRLIEEV